MDGLSIRTEGRRLIPQPVSQNELVHPLCIILVKDGSKGDRLIFRYPNKQCLADTPQLNQSTPKSPQLSPSKQISPGNFGANTRLGFQQGSARLSGRFQRNLAFSDSRSQSTQSLNILQRNPYAIPSNTEDELNCFGLPSFDTIKPSASTNRKTNIAMELNDKELSNLLAVNAELSERKFELKVNDVRFVGHPTLMQHSSIIRPVNPGYQTSTKLFHVVFCLHARASHSIVKCFYDLSKRLGIALRHEEYRCSYLSQQMKYIITHLDEVCQEHEDEEEIEQNYFQYTYKKIIDRSSLCQLLKCVYDDVCRTGIVKCRVNDWIQLSFCLPQKIHVLPFRDPFFILEPENVHKCLESIRPYHALLLLTDRDELARSFWIDGSSTVLRLLQVYSPIKSLQVTAADADLTLSQVVEIVSHLVYWGVASVIYPLCETNVYVIAPDAPIFETKMEDAFVDAFPGLSLNQILSDFSLPMPLGERVNPVLGGSYLQAQIVQLVCWLLQNRLLIQLHTYVYLLPYLDENGLENSLSNGQEYPGTMEVRPFEHEHHHATGEDDLTISDSFSEAATDELGVIVHSDPFLSTTIAAAAIPSTPQEEKPNECDAVDGRRSGETGTDSNSVNNTQASAETKISKEEESKLLLKEALNELPPLARGAVETIQSLLNVAEIKLFGRIHKYFTGEFHFEEIMYRENVRRSQLLLLVDKFRDLLIISEREDSSINFFKVESW